MPIFVQGEIALPANPNCILYSADALAILPGKDWVSVQRAAWLGLERFYSASGIDAVAWFGRRVALDRKNLASTQMLLMFVFDGPATRDHLEILDAGVLEHSPVWGQSSVAPLPHKAFPSLTVKSGKFYQLWTATEGGPVTYTLEVDDQNQVLIRALPPSACDANDFLPYVRHVVGVRPTLKEVDVELERLKVAFSLTFAERIVEADGRVQGEEVDFLERVFPFEMLDRMGLNHPETLRTTFEAASTQLIDLLGHHEKLALIGLFFAACHSDGHLDATEMSLLREAADLLGVERNDVVDYLRRIW